MRHWSITAFGKWRVDKDKYFVDNNGYVMRALQECLQFDAILKYDWHALIPQPIAEEMFPATTRHLRKFRRTITLWEFRKDAIKRRHARGIVPIYVLRKQPIG